MKENAQKQSVHIGIVVNPAIRPCRYLMSGFLRYVEQLPSVETRLFLASVATTPENLVKFAESGLDGIMICGIRRGLVFEFLHLMPCHPSIVLCASSPLSESERGFLGPADGIVQIDNAEMGSLAADYFLGHSLQNFAFITCNFFYERYSGDIRCAAFEERLRAALGEHMTFARFMVGTGAANADYWESDAGELERILLSLPLPCGVFVNSDGEAGSIFRTCSRLGLAIPNQIEVLGINNSYEARELLKLTLSSIYPNREQCAEKAVELLLALIADSGLPQERRYIRISGSRLVEGESTASRRDFGHIALRVREYVRANACKGIGVMDVVKHLGVSRRVIEKRVREATGKSVLDMIQKARLENVCRLLKKTDLPIAEVTIRSGYELTANLGRLFRRTYGMSMRDYRAKENIVHT